jgi:hypothetical protein
MTNEVKEKILASWKAENDNDAGTYSGEVLDVLALYGANDTTTSIDWMSSFVTITSWNTPADGEMNMSDTSLEFTVTDPGTINGFRILSSYAYPGGPTTASAETAGVLIPITPTTVEAGDKVKLTELALGISD